MLHRRFLRPRTLLVPAAVAALSIGAALPASAGHHASGGDAGGIKIIATGLDNPRQLSFAANGDLYIAEAGRGGSGPCMVGPEGANVCFGTTGAVTRITGHGRQSRVLTGLPSIANQGDPENPAGSSAIGPSDVLSLGGHKIALLIGLGANPAVRAGLPAAGRKMGTLLQADLRTRSTHRISDVAAIEAAKNPIHDPDSDPVGMLRECGRFVVTDAGGNDVLRVGKSIRPRILAVLQDQLADAPPFLGLPPGTQIPAQSVPTSVAIGPDGAYYVSQLTGFPFPKGGANIYRIGRNGHVSVYASGLTNVTDLAWSGHKLYAVEISAEGLLNGPVGALVKVNRNGAHQVIAGDLPSPYGIAIKGKSAYVTTGSVAPGGGQVMRIPLNVSST